MGALLVTVLDVFNGNSGNMDNSHLEERLERLKEKCDRQTELSVTDQLNVSRIPLTIGYFSNLTRLDLRNNSIEEIPWSIIYLKKLEYLNLDHNFVTLIPRVIGFLDSLEVFSLQHNNVKLLPTELLQLRRLHTLNVDENPIVSPPQLICAHGWEAVKLSLQYRNERHNMWKGTVLHLTDPGFSFPTLFELCVRSVLDEGVDLIDAQNLPIVMKNYIVKENEEHFQMCKCSQCGGYFSTRLLYETHTCRASKLAEQQLKAISKTQKKISLSACTEDGATSRGLLQRFGAWIRGTLCKWKLRNYPTSNEETQPRRRDPITEYEELYERIQQENDEA